MSADIAADVLAPDIRAQVRAARSAQPWWADIAIAERAAVIGETARRLAADAPALASVIAAASERPLAEVWPSEIVPTLVINEELQPVAQPDVPLAGRGASGFAASRGRADRLPGSLIIPAAQAAVRAIWVRAATRAAHSARRAARAPLSGPST